MQFVEILSDSSRFLLLLKLDETYNSLFGGIDTSRPITYAGSKVTRVIPEWGFQFGKLVRRSQKNPPLLDVSTCNDTYESQTGLVFAVGSHENSKNSPELFVLLCPYHSQVELLDYQIVGRCINWRALREWMQKIDTKPPGYERPVSPVWIGQCGVITEVKDTSDSELGLKFDSLNESASNAKEKIKKRKRKQKAVDLLFKKKAV
ncbi:hypothetical protein DAMA08_036540 [Martiniozyma asiatica (nom. inval.)]|nr:hypothetical protein DAMA08_036540 [Martiniozyma asiatica]